MKTQQRTHLSGTLMGLAVAALLSGCATFTNACTDIGWTNRVDVQFTGPAAAIAIIETMEVCGEETCWKAPRPTATPTSPPGAIEAYEFPATAVTDTRWALAIGMDTPESITITARTADGTVLGTTESDVDWTRVGGTAQCGGPHEGGPVELDVAL
ncbi:hypothetical protein [Pseudoclavibacter sp. JSM 162008]|uniref:hypothetical protein n=1 Tax=Pseudoclavibacter sp. JSM 162008 TaxID=3229855 RepID=UPI00352522A8